MKKILLGLTAAAVMAGAFALPAQADDWRHDRWEHRGSRVDRYEYRHGYRHYGPYRDHRPYYRPVYRPVAYYPAPYYAPYAYPAFAPGVGLSFNFR